MKRSRSRARGGYRSIYWAVRKSFTTGRDGYLHRFTVDDLNQLSTGTTPVTVATDPTGLVMDARLGLSLGPDLVDTINTAAAWTASGTNTVAQDGDAVKITFVDNAAGAVALFSAAAGLSSNLTVGANYKITYQTKVNSGSVNAAVVNASTNQSVAITATDYITQEFFFTASNATTNNFTFANMSAGEIVWIKNISVKLFSGNHAIQATAGARPTWTNRVNQKTASNDFTTGWTQQGTPTPTQDAVGIDGLVSAWTLTDNDAVTNAEAIYRQDQSYIAGVTYTHSVFVKKTTGVQTNFPAFAYRNFAQTHQAGCNIDTTNGTALAWTSRTGVTIVTSSVVVESYNSDFWRVSLTFLAQSTDTAAWVLFYPAFRASLDAVGDAVAAVTGSAVFTAQQIEFGTVATRYQRVTTASDFDTAGFPYYLSFLGTDDSLTSATGGGGSNGFFWCGVVQPTGGAGTARHILNDIGAANTGYVVQIGAANKLDFAAGNGVAYTIKSSTATISVGTKYLLTVWDDGVNLNVQVDSGAVETVARPVVSAGSSGYTIGKNHSSAANYLIGNVYPSVYWKDTAGTAAERANAQAYARMMAGL